MYVPCVILLDHIAEALDLIRVKAEPGQLKSLGTDAFVAFTLPNGGSECKCDKSVRSRQKF